MASSSCLLILGFAVCVKALGSTMLSQIETISLDPDSPSFFDSNSLREEKKSAVTSSPAQQQKKEVTLEAKATTLEKRVTTLEAKVEEMIEAVGKDPQGVHRLRNAIDERLHAETEKKYVGLVKRLIQKNRDVNKVSILRKPALTYAAMRKFKDIVQILLDAKADVDKKDITGLTALTYASQGHDADIVKELINGKADVNTKDTDGFTPFFHAVNRASAEDHVETVIKLVEAKADVTDNLQRAMTGALNTNRNTAKKIYDYLYDTYHRDPQISKKIVEAWSNSGRKSSNQHQ